MVYRSERDDWILAMIASGLGFGFMPENCVSHPGVVARHRRAGILARGESRDCAGAATFARPRSPGARSYARQVAWSAGNLAELESAISPGKTQSRASLIRGPHQDRTVGYRIGEEQ